MVIIKWEYSYRNKRMLPLLYMHLKTELQL